MYTNIQTRTTSDQKGASCAEMPFPDTPRVIYDRNPLEEVICQLKFPPILKIDSESPASFQDGIRRTYPFFQEIPGVLIDVPSEIVKMLPALAGTKSYSFESPERSWKVTLNREFVALSTTAYVRWEDFRARLITVLDALERHYQPTFFLRVGLRYRDVIRPSCLGIESVQWTALLKPWILGELSQEAIAPYIKQATGDVLITLNGETGQVRLRHGLVQPTDQSETIYSIDCDFYREGTTERRNVIELLNVYNKEAGRLFRWCISDELSARLGPRPVAAAQ